MSDQDVVRARDLMLVFWTGENIRGMRHVVDRIVFPREWPGYYMAAVVPVPSDEEAFKNAKEIK